MSDVTEVLKGKVALVTGAAAGIGQAIAQAFVEQAATVVVADVSREAGQAVVEALGPRAQFVYVDVTRPETLVEQVQHCIHVHGTLDILVNNAYPTMAHGPAALEQIDSERLRFALTAGFDAAAAAMRAAYPAMQSAGWGRVINICSLNGVNAHRYTADYNAAKEALRAYTRTAAVEWARSGITANVICPGAVTTPLKALMEFSPGMADDIAATNPMGYMGDPLRDIAPVAVFLASEQSRYMTGNTLYVDGGGHINGVPWAPQID